MCVWYCFKHIRKNVLHAAVQAPPERTPWQQSPSALSPRSLANDLSRNWNLPEEFTCKTERQEYRDDVLKTTPKRAAQWQNRRQRQSTVALTCVARQTIVQNKAVTTTTALFGRRIVRAGGDRHCSAHASRSLSTVVYCECLLETSLVLDRPRPRPPVWRTAPYNRHASISAADWSRVRYAWRLTAPARPPAGAYASGQARARTLLVKNLPQYRRVTPDINANNRRFDGAALQSTGNWVRRRVRPGKEEGEGEGWSLVNGQG